MQLLSLAQQRQLIERRLTADRRKAQRAYHHLDTTVEARSGTDRRAPQQLLLDNQFINNWMSSFHQHRSISS